MSVTIAGFDRMGMQGAWNITLSLTMHCPGMPTILAEIGIRLESHRNEFYFLLKKTIHSSERVERSGLEEACKLLG